MIKVWIHVLIEFAHDVFLVCRRKYQYSLQGFWPEALDLHGCRWLGQFTTAGRDNRGEVETLGVWFWMWQLWDTCLEKQLDGIRYVSGT